MAFVRERGIVIPLSPIRWKVNVSVTNAPKTKTIVLATRNPKKIIELEDMLHARIAGDDGYEVIDLSTLEERLGLPQNTLGDIEETGTSYEENAEMKAQEVATAICESGIDPRKERYIVVADDSGFELEGVTWKPGACLTQAENDRLAGKPFPGVDTSPFKHAVGCPHSAALFYHDMLGGQGGMRAVTVLKVVFIKASNPTADNDTATMVAATPSSSSAAATPSMAQGDLTHNFTANSDVKRIEVGIEHAPTFKGEIRGKMVWPPRGENGFADDGIFEPHGLGRTFGEMSTDEKNQISQRARAMEQFVQSLAIK